MKERNHIIDALKGFGMILVVGGHCGTPFFTYYYTFHMGLFFFLSGYLMTDNIKVISFGEFFRRKCKNIIYPYVVFFAITLIMQETLAYKNNGSFFLLEKGHLLAFFAGGGVSC